MQNHRFSRELWAHNYADGVPKIMDQIFDGLWNTHASVDDILIDTKDTQEYERAIEWIVLGRSKTKITKMKTENWIFAVEEAEFLRLELYLKGMQRYRTTDQGFREHLRTKRNQTELPSCLGAINQMNRFVPTIAQLCFASRSVSREENLRKGGK